LQASTPSNAIFACLQADARRAGARAKGPGGQQGNDSVASAAGSHPRHRLFGQATPGPGHHPTATPGGPPPGPARGRGRAGHSSIAATLPPRARTRYRKKLIEQRVSEGQRLAKVLEDGIKIDSVASKLLGKSGRAMIEALTAGERDPERLAGLALGVLRRKTEDLEPACDGRFTAAHAQMCRLHLDAYDHLSGTIAELDALVAEAAAPFAALIARLVTIPGIGQRTAEVIVAETGGDMARFGTSARLAAWAGLAPGDNESAGKRKHAAARKGNRHLRAAMVEAAWAAARTRTRPGARFRRLARRFGRGHDKKAAVAVAHTLTCITWAVLSHGHDYAEAGEDYYEQRDRRNREHLIRHHQQALARLGCQVTLDPPGDGYPPSAGPDQQPAA
jgi:transposase